SKYHNYRHEERSQEGPSTDITLQAQPLLGVVRFAFESCAVLLQRCLTRPPQRLDVPVFLWRGILVAGVASGPRRRVFRPPGLIRLRRCRTKRGAFVGAEYTGLDCQSAPALSVFELAQDPADRLVAHRIAHSIRQPLPAADQRLVADVDIGPILNRSRRIG